ncbi:MAG: hypothetical protein ACPHVW_06580 [Parvibaculales bacterium]
MKKKKGAAMDNYHLMADFFSTWRSMNDITKNIFVIGFYLTIIACLFARYWLHDWLISRKELRQFYFQNHEALVRERKRKAEAQDRTS